MVSIRARAFRTCPTGRANLTRTIALLRAHDIITLVFFGPFLFLYAILFFVGLTFLFALIQIGIINYVFQALGLSPHLAFLALLVSLVGSYLNVPITRVESDTAHSREVVRHFGIRYRPPIRYAGRSTTVAINVGGAIVPLAISTYVLVGFLRRDRRSDQQCEQVFGK